MNRYMIESVIPKRRRKEENDIRCPGFFLVIEWFDQEQPTVSPERVLISFPGRWAQYRFAGVTRHIVGCRVGWAGAVGGKQAGLLLWVPGRCAWLNWAQRGQLHLHWHLAQTGNFIIHSKSFLYRSIHHGYILIYFSIQVFDPQLQIENEGIHSIQAIAKGRTGCLI